MRILHRAERDYDPARAKVKVAMQLAVNAVWDIQPQTCTANVAGTIGRAISSLTPSHAKSALEAYGRSKVQEGMQRAVDLYPQGIAAIRDDMEKLK